MRILVIGEHCLDVFIYGECNRLSPEAPIVILNPTERKTNSGMAGNVYQNLLSLGCEQVDLICNEEIITKTRFVEGKSNHPLLRVDENDRVENTFDISKIDFSLFSAVVVSDYNKGFLTEENLRQISYAHPLTFLDTKKVLKSFAHGFNFIKINESEWNNCVKNGCDIKEWESQLIVTKGSEGAMYNGKVYPTQKVAVADISGAGDSFLAALVVSYLKNNNIETAIKYANDISGIVVQKKGVSTI